jgi:uncharacterized protein (DUF58 family)
VLLVVDQRPSMQFGSRHCFKSVLAAELAALLAWSALGANERVGGLLLRAEDHWEMRPRNSRRTVLALLSALADDIGSGTPGQDYTPRFADLLRSARRVARPGSTLFLISDFDGCDSEEARRELFQLARHTEITGIHVSDPLEAKLPPAGEYTVTDGRDRIDLDTADRGLEAAFATEFERRVAGCREQFERLGLPLLEAKTDDVPLALLRRFYGDGSA